MSAQPDATTVSNDLRRKFFQVYDAGEGTLQEVAKRFRVSLSWAKKTSARRTKTGKTEVAQWRRGPRSLVTAAQREWIGEQIRRQPDFDPAGVATAAGTGTTAAIEPGLDLGRGAAFGATA